MYKGFLHQYVFIRMGIIPTSISAILASSFLLLLQLPQHHCLHINTLSCSLGLDCECPNRCTHESPSPHHASRLVRQCS
ncbi:hypothetical protein EV426DRAFT_596055 [Tirmania nivea]|nr:hypothetical protein EV426DRAFT_596055 [Tirmania nivea]